MKSARELGENNPLIHIWYFDLGDIFSMKTYFRFYFYPQWNYEKAEAWLSDMENSGLRMTGVYFYWWFRFTKCQPKKTRYFFCCNFIKEESAMYECEWWLKSVCGANEIKERNTYNPAIYRMTSSECDLTDLFRFRQNYIRHILAQKLMIALIFLGLGVSLGITSACSAEQFRFASLLLSLWVMVLSGAVIAWCLYGLSYLYRHRIR